MPKPISKTEKDTLRLWLRSKGHKLAKLSKLKWDTDEDERASIAALHGLEYDGNGRYKGLK